MRLQKVQDALNKKNITFEYTEYDFATAVEFARNITFPIWPFSSPRML